MLGWRARGGSAGSSRDDSTNAPKGVPTVLVFGEMVSTLESKGDQGAAPRESPAPGEHVRETCDAPAILMRAVRESEGRLQDLDRQAEILEDVATRFPWIRFGSRATNEAARLRAEDWPHPPRHGPRPSWQAPHTTPLRPRWSAHCVGSRPGQCS